MNVKSSFLRFEAWSASPSTLLLRVAVVLLVLIVTELPAVASQAKLPLTLPTAKGLAAQQPHIPIVYDAYYPTEKPKIWRTDASLEEIDQLHRLTEELLRQEEQLLQLKAATVDKESEDILAARERIVDYAIFEAAQLRKQQMLDQQQQQQQQQQHQQKQQQQSRAEEFEYPLQIASLTVSDLGPNESKEDHQRRVRHHHGQPNWLLRRLARKA
ncbi:putative uncharacterized protein DDB_G0271606 isoform X2 [Trichogramma pretiosum]|nr:putative uncharacterized protein DDB_G0271606 isoform X2 [Trichogramma pretiosum]XP_014238411.1 putative uncharacterized protein DDB_G0271606 isoform X2 [Trichogramma pretiosum]